MAQGPDSLEHLLSCQVCFHEFQEDGEHIPRLLPCTHTLCESCIGQLIRNDKLECPECRKVHEAKGVKSFPQNKYILTQIKRKSHEHGGSVFGTEMCKEHEKELILFCTESACQKAICIECLKQSHRKHDVTDVEDGRKEVALQSVVSIKRNLQTKIAMIVATRVSIKIKTENCISDIIKQKEAIIKHFETMIKDAEKKEEEMMTKLNNEITTLTENLSLLTTIEKKIAEEAGPEENLKTDEFETLKELKENANKILSGKRTYTYLEYAPGDSSTSSVCGSIVEFELGVKLPVIPKSTKRRPLRMKNVSHTSQLKCTVSLPIDTGLAKIGPTTLLSNGTIVLWGNRKGQEKRELQQYKPHTEFLLNCFDVEDDVWGTAEVKVDGRSTLALGYGVKKNIEFYDINDYTKMLHSHSVAPHQPVRLCAMSDSTLLYIDDSKIPRKVHRLKCRTLPPISPPEYKSLYLSEEMWWDMCFVREENKNLLIVSSVERSGIEAYNADTASLEWKGQLPVLQRCGVASDGQGHIFVCDQAPANRCIHMFSASDGKYQGCLIGEGEQGLGVPLWAVWSEPTSSLIVTHRKGDKRFFSVIYIQVQDVKSK